MRCHFFQWIDGPEMYDRAFIQQKYMLNYSVRAENFVRWKPYVPDPVEEAPKEPRTRPGVIHIDDVSYEEFTSLLRFSLYGVLTSYNRRTWTTSTYQPEVDSLATRARERLMRLSPAATAYPVARA